MTDKIQINTGSSGGSGTYTIADSALFDGSIGGYITANGGGGGSSGNNWTVSSWSNLSNQVKKPRHCYE